MRKFVAFGLLAIGLAGCVDVNSPGFKLEAASACRQAGFNVDQTCYSAYAEIKQRQALENFGNALQAAGTAMQQAEYNRQAAAAYNRPTTTNCWRNGMFVTCNTY
jgi:hypothetical protein